mmetsp:Transcript_55103/g.76420  ORF Transcript_55103/g.76420 Transcript_55103/m.76420 type:complete len:86 (+) Transcript_55103:89-346(+)
METVKTLAKMNATIILANRSYERTKPFLDGLIQSTKNNNLHFIKLDLSDLDSVREFVKEFKSKFNRLDILINNAGISNKSFKPSA